MAKAKGGDLKAAQFVTDLVIGKSPVVQMNVGVRDKTESRQSAVKKTASLIRRRSAAAAILAKGSLPIADLAARLGLTEPAMMRVINHPWFVRLTDGLTVQITTLGRKEGLET